MNMLKLNVIAVLLVVLLTAGFGFGLLVPGAKELRACQSGVVAKAEEVSSRQQIVGDVSVLYASILAMDEEMRDFQKRLPSERQLGEFLRDVSDNLQSSGVTNYIVQPRPALQVDAEKLPASLKEAAGTTILPVRVSFKSDFGRLFEFVGKMEALPRLSHVEELSLVNDEQNPGTVQVEMMLHTYYYSSQ
ncbi:MAG: type 4a pilus biogenesis protein PilO [Planctomycetota bacterium]